MGNFAIIILSFTRIYVKMLALIILTCLSSFVEGNADVKINFVRSFVENERKPTNLMFSLCWGKNDNLKLVKSMHNIGVRSASGVKPDYYDHSCLFLLDLDCGSAEQALLEATSKHLFRAPYRWLLLSNSSGNAINETLHDVPLLADSDLVLAEYIDDGYRMVELHRSSPKGPLLTTLRGYYNINNGVLNDVRPHRTLFRRRKDLRGHPLTMANVIQDSNSTQYHLPREDRLEPEHDFIAKASWSTVKLGFLMLNATPMYIFSHRWGYLLNGTWSGMIDDIISNRADVGTNCLTKKDRLPVVVFTDNLAPFRVRFVFRQPPLSYVSNIFSLPFSTGVWSALLICSTAGVFAVYAASSWEARLGKSYGSSSASSHCHICPTSSLSFSTGVWIALLICSAAGVFAVYAASSWEARLGKSPTQLDGSIGDALLLTMSALSQQGCVLEPRKASGRIMLLILFAALMALYAAYSANIVVLLQAPSKSIRTLAQLAHSGVTLGALDVDYNHFVFKLYSSDPVRLEIFKKVDPEKGKKQFYEINEGVERIRQGLFAFHAIVEPVYRRIEETFLESEKCDLTEVDFMNDFDPFTPVKKDSPYLELLRVVFKQIRESGIRDVITRRLRTPKPRCAQTSAAFSSVGLLDLQPVLILMLYGIALSVAIALLEIILFRIKRCRQGRVKASFNTVQ